MRRQRGLRLFHLLGLVVILAFVLVVTREVLVERPRRARVTALLLRHDQAVKRLGLVRASERDSPKLAGEFQKLIEWHAARARALRQGDRPDFDEEERQCTKHEKLEQRLAQQSLILVRAAIQRRHQALQKTVVQLQRETEALLGRFQQSEPDSGPELPEGGKVRNLLLTEPPKFQPL